MSATGGRVFLDQVSISGIGAPIYAEYDYTDPSVAAEYYEQISILNEILTRQTNSPAITNPTITATDVANVNAALAALQDLAINGISANSTANIQPPVVTMKQYFLTSQMATNLDLLFRSFEAVGGTGSPPQVTQAQLTQWKDLSTVSPVIADVLRAATYAAASNRSLQSLVELEYVKTGSDLIGDKLSGLNDALTTTNNILNSLAALQDIRNRMVVTNPTGYTPPTSAMVKAIDLANGNNGIHAADLMSAYRGAASLYFNQKIVPQIAPTLIQGTPPNITLTAAGETIYNNLLAIQRSLLAFIPQLSGIVGTSGVLDSASIYNRIKKISGDLSALFQAGGQAAANLTNATDRAKALQTYLLDNTVSAFSVTGRNAGDGQSNMGFGITAAQGLNDTQKEDVRRFLNIFEEYYKSASAILQKISQIIEKMAQNINR